MMMETAHFPRRVEAAAQDTWEANQSSVASHTTQHVHREGAIVFSERSEALAGPTHVAAETHAHRDRLAQDTTGFVCHAGVLAVGLARESERYQLQVIASGRVALAKSKLDLFGAHSRKWRLATSTLSRLPNAQA
jgi:hypothetical protein